MNNYVFDWSGVIKDGFESHHWVVNKIFEKYGVKEISLEQLRSEWVEPYMNFYQKYLPDITLEQEQADYREGVSNVDCPKLGPYPGIVNLVKKLKQQGNYLAIVSSDLSETLIPEIKDFGLENIFNDVLTLVYDKTSSLQQLIHKNNLVPNQTYIIGDSHNEVNAAKQTGVKSIAVTWGFTQEHKLTASSPDFIAHNIDELEKILF